MTLTELQYIVVLAQEHHFGRAADRAFVTQPALSLAIKKLEDDIRENIKNQEATEADIENQRKALEVLKARRTGT